MGHRARELGGSKRHARGQIIRLFTNLSFALRDQWASLWVAVCEENCESLVLCSCFGYPAPSHPPHDHPPHPQHAHHHHHLPNHQRPHQGSSEVLRRCRGYSLPCRHWGRDGWRGGAGIFFKIANNRKKTCKEENYWITFDLKSPGARLDEDSRPGNEWMEDAGF